MGTKIYVRENLTPYNQRLPWKCKELKRAKKDRQGMWYERCYQN